MNVVVDHHVHLPLPTRHAHAQTPTPDTSATDAVAGRHDVDRPGVMNLSGIPGSMAATLPSMVAEDSDQHLTQVFGDLAVQMQAQRGASDTLKSIVEAAAQIVPGARWAGISMIRGKQVVAEVPPAAKSPNWTSCSPIRATGPCVTALREHHTVHIDDIATDTRWPAFAREAQRRGMLSLLSFQLFVRSENLGTLNLYGGEPGVFSEDSLLIGGVLAQHAAVALIGSSAEQHFEAALASRDIIGQAKGMLMLLRENRTALKAFNLLIRVSQETNIKLIDVARWLVNEHESKLLGRSHLGQIAVLTDRLFLRTRMQRPIALPLV